MGDFLKPEGFAGPRGLCALAQEASVVAEAARFLRRPRAAHTLSGGEAPVLLVPGFMAGDATLAGMGLMLRGAGYRTYRSGIRLNVACTRETADRLEARLEEIAERRGRRVSIVGHSLGGMLARGLAARRPDLIAGIVAMGSPILAPGAVHDLLVRDADLLTRLARLGVRGLMGADCISGECARTSFEETRAALDPSVGFTAIYSRRDGIADWRACLDPSAIAVEVTASHVGMALDPLVFDVVRSALDAQRTAYVEETATA